MIMIGTKYRLRRLDAQNIVIERGGIQKEGKQAGEWTVSGISYYGSFALAVNSMLERLTNEAMKDVEGIEDLKKMASRVEEIRGELLKVVAEIKAGKADEAIPGEETEIEEEVEA